MKREDLRAIGEESPKEIIFYRQIARVNVLNSYNPIGGDVEEIPRAILRFDEDQEVFLYTNEQSPQVLGKDPWAMPGQSVIIRFMIKVFYIRISKQWQMRFRDQRRVLPMTLRQTA